MSDLTAALARVDKLSPIDGKTVVGCSVKLTNAGDGLSQAMKVEPVELHQGERVYILTEGIVQRLIADPIDKDDPGGLQRRVHVVKAGTSTLVDAAFAKARLDDQAAKIRKAIEESQGIVPLPETGTVSVPDAGKPKRTKRASKPKNVDDDGFYDPKPDDAQPVGKAVKNAVAKLPKPTAVPDLPDAAESAAIEADPETVAAIDEGLAELNDEQS